MIKAICTDGNERKVLLLGLSHINLDKLREHGLDGFIKVDGDEVGVPFDVLITAGETEASMMQGLSALVGPDTKLHIADKLKS